MNRLFLLLMTLSGLVSLVVLALAVSVYLAITRWFHKYFEGEE